jgi:hypothetical protein
MSWEGSHVIQGHDHVMEGSMTDTLEPYHSEHGVGAGKDLAQTLGPTHLTKKNLLQCGVTVAKGL